uniref:RING-type domain-containing protein n=1 Tax=Kalanchoe fedtschenkoi TaxID=63787 RepID=A0A7N0T777_KALFE
MMTSVVENSNIGICTPHKNKRKARADKRLRDLNKADTHKLSVKNKNILLDHGLNGVCQMYGDSESDTDSQKQNLGRSNSSLQGGLFEDGSDGAKEETDACAVVFGQCDISDDVNSNLRSHALPKNQLDNAMKRLDMDLNPPILGHIPSSAADFQMEIPSWIPNMAESKKTQNLNKRSFKEEIAQSSASVVDWSFIVSRTSQRLEGRGKFNSSRKVHISGTFKKESNLARKLHHLDKGCHTHGYNKSTFRQGKFFGLSIDKKVRSCGEYGEFNRRSASMKISKAVAVKISEDSSKHNCTSAKVDANPTSHLFRGGVASSLPVSSGSSDYSSGKAVRIDLSKMKKEPSQSSGSCRVDFPGCNHEGITYEDAKGQSTKPDPKADLIFQLVSRSYKLKDQLEQWTEWANSKVLQATLRLTKHKEELNALRQEKRDPERLKQSIEENAMKKLSEIENALSKANGQVEHANCAFRRLDLQNSDRKQEMEAAKLRAMESAANCQEISERERKALSSVQSGDKQKSLLQAELNSEKQKHAHALGEFMKTRGALTQLEDKRGYELKAKEDMQLQVHSIRKDIEQGEALRKLKEDAFRSKAESNLQKYKDDIQMLEREIIELSLSADVNKAVALKKGTNDVGKLSSTKKFPMFPEASLSHISKEARNSCKKGAKDVKRDRECVMCLSEEISVVFLPCAHQVICAKCNQLHENSGMKDCPSCRSMIKRRIAVRYFVP